MEELIAFHGDPKVKAFYLRRVHNHRKADEIIHGKYWENGRGCGVGCTIHSDDHNAYETELGIPVQIAYLEDAIFEGMANGKSKEFPERFLKAIKPGVDLSLVVPRLVVWQGLDPKHGVINLVKSNEERECVKLVAGLYQRIIDGGTVTYQEWVDAENQAGAGAWVWARAGAWAGARARVWAGARAQPKGQKQWEILADKFIELLKSAPV